MWLCRAVGVLACVAMVVAGAVITYIYASVYGAPPLFSTALAVGFVLAVFVHELEHLALARRRVVGIGLSPLGPFVLVRFDARSTLAPALLSVPKIVAGALLARIPQTTVAAVGTALLYAGLLSLIGSAVDLAIYATRGRVGRALEEKVLTRFGIYITLRGAVWGEDLVRLSRELDEQAP